MKSVRALALQLSALSLLATAGLLSLPAHAKTVRDDVSGAKQVTNAFKAKLSYEHWNGKGDWNSHSMGSVKGVLTVDFNVTVPRGEYTGNTGTIALDNGETFPVVVQEFQQNRPNLGLCVLSFLFGGGNCNNYMYQREVILDKASLRKVALAADHVWYRKKKTEDAVAALIERAITASEETEFHFYTGMISGHSKGRARERLAELKLLDKQADGNDFRMVLDVQFDDDVHAVR